MNYYRKSEIPPEMQEYFEPAEIGLEPTPEAYVEKLVAVFREVRRVLRDDGTLWLNLGDSYASIGHKKSNSGYGTTGLAGGIAQEHSILHHENNGPGLKHKDLIGIPWRVAFALQADGWYLRSEIIWSKANPMPESVTDRPTKSHEQIFLLSKSPRYYYDAEAIKEPCLSGLSDIRKMTESLERIGGKHKDLIDPLSKASAATNIGRKRAVGDPGGRNRRSVWNINTVPFPGSHFAVFPPAIPEICIKAGTSEKGCCPECGSPWERVVEKTGTGRVYDRGACMADHRAIGTAQHTGSGSGALSVISTTTGWRPTCTHNHDPVPCTVLDPFSGAGTTGLVAEKLGRKYIGIELNQDYADMAAKRIEAARLPMEALLAGRQ